MTTEPGLRESFYVEGFNFSSDPSALTYTPEIGEERNVARNGKLLVHGALPFVGCCRRFSRLNLSLKWDVISGPDIDIANDLIAFGGPLDVCIWRPWSEYFLGGSGTLQRRNAVDVIDAAFLPLTASTRYALVGMRAGVADTVTLGTINADHQTPWTSTGSAGGIFIRYYPVIRVYVAEGQPLFSPGGSQGQTLSFEEACS